MSSSFTTIASDTEINRTAKALTAHGIAVQVVETGEAARGAVLKLIPKGSEVFTNTSATLDETGIAKMLNGPDFVSARSKMMALYADPEKKKEMKQIAATPDFAVGSAHAITAAGQLLIASATGSQLSGEAYGADKVVFVVSAQKLVKDLAEGIKRIEEHIVPLEDKRAMAAYGSHTSFNKLLVINGEVPGRITVVIVKERLGF